MQLNLKAYIDNISVIVVWSLHLYILHTFFIHALIYVWNTYLQVFMCTYVCVYKVHVNEKTVHLCSINSWLKSINVIINMHVNLQNEWPYICYHQDNDHTPGYNEIFPSARNITFLDNRPTISTALSQFPYRSAVVPWCQFTMENLWNISCWTRKLLSLRKGHYGIWLYYIQSVYLHMPDRSFMLLYLTWDG